MARDPDDPNVTDLRAYKRKKEKAARKPRPAPKRPSESFLGSNPRAALILVAVIAIIALLYLGPRFL